MLLNLFGNGFYAATKHLKDGTEPSFRPTLKVTTRDLGEAVEIRVRDNGAGIPPEIRDKLFQPFFTTKPTGEGTGLGLSISWDIVTQQHGGTIASTARPALTPNSPSACRGGGSEQDPSAQRSEAGAGGGVEDRVGVDAVGAVKVGDVARLAETLDPERHDPARPDGAEPGQCRGVEIADRDQRRIWAQPRQQLLGRALSVLGLRRAPIAVQPAGRGDREQSRLRHVFKKLPVGGEGFGGDRTAIGDREIGIGAGLAQPIGAGHHRLGESRLDLSLRLLDRPR